MVRFNTQGIGTAPAALTVIKGSKLTTAQTPVPVAIPTGKSFGGWFKNAACPQPWNNTPDTVTADITLYAKWTPKMLSKQDLWKSKETEWPTNYFRIPALAETKDGTLIAVTDLRYNHSADIGKFGPNGEWGQDSHIHRVDVTVKRSTDHGVT